MLVWVMMGIAIWHFAVFVPDHFWGGIVGAFVAAILGAVVIGLALAGGEIDDAIARRPRWRRSRARSPASASLLHRPARTRAEPGWRSVAQARA